MLGLTVVGLTSNADLFLLRLRRVVDSPLRIKVPQGSKIKVKYRGVVLRYSRTSQVGAQVEVKLVAVTILGYTVLDALLIGKAAVLGQTASE